LENDPQNPVVIGIFLFSAPAALIFRTVDLKFGPIFVSVLCQLYADFMISYFAAHHNHAQNPPLSLLGLYKSTDLITRNSRYARK
jgi:hypothetical protein